MLPTKRTLNRTFRIFVLRNNRMGGITRWAAFPRLPLLWVPSTTRPLLRPIILFVLSKLHPASPTRSVLRAWWSSPIRYETDTKSSSGSLPRAICIVHWEVHWLGLFHPTDVHFSQDQSPHLSQDRCHPLSYIPWPCNGMRRPKVL